VDPIAGLFSRSWPLLAVCLLLLVPVLDAAETLGATEAGQGRDPIPLTLALPWQPQSQFAGYYLARDKGYYRAAGVELSFLHANSERGSLALLAEGKAELALAALTDALPQASGLVQIAQMVRRDTNMIIGWKDMGITRVLDLDGKPLSFWNSVATTFEAFFALNDVRPIRIPQYYSVNLFLARGVAACAAKEYNEFHRIWQAGIDPEQISAFRIRDYGLGFPEDGLYAEAGWAAHHSDLLASLRQASLQGWRYAQSHPEEAIALVMAEMRRARVPTNLPHEQWMLRHILDDIFIPGEDQALAGRLTATEFEQVAETLQAAGLLQAWPSFAHFAPLEVAAGD